MRGITTSRRPATVGSALIASLIFLVAAPAAASPRYAAPELFWTAERDFDGDGRIEVARVVALDSGGRYRLSVGAAEATGHLNAWDGSSEVDGFAVVDLDSGDRFMEIAVHSPGPSDDDEWDLYALRSGQLKLLGTVSRWPRFPGNGTVVVGRWMGFWEKLEKYRYDRRSGRLARVPQELYHVGVSGRTTRRLSLNSFRDRSGELAVVRAGGSVTILASSGEESGDEWYLVKSEGGLLGWADRSHLLERLPKIFLECCKKIAVNFVGVSVNT